jgi:hypothetical protein
LDLYWLESLVRQVKKFGSGNLTRVSVYIKTLLVKPTNISVTLKELVRTPDTPAGRLPLF